MNKEPDCEFKVGDLVQVLGAGPVLERVALRWVGGRWVTDARDVESGAVYYDGLLTNLVRAE